MTRRKIPVWDLPLRLFHWSLAALVCAAIVTALIGGNAMLWHGRIGIVISGLLGFRLVWGVIGTRTARFVHFVRGPRSIAAYLRGEWQGIGHNPLGALSVLAMLALFAFQTLGGLFTDDDIAFRGPLRALVSKSTSNWITGIHHDMLPWLAALIILHVGAIIWYRRIRQADLLSPMLRGWTIADESCRENTRVNLLALLVAIAFGIACATLASGVWIPPPDAAPAPAPAW